MFLNIVDGFGEGVDYCELVEGLEVNVVFFGIYMSVFVLIGKCKCFILN